MEKKKNWMLSQTKGKSPKDSVTSKTAELFASSWLPIGIVARPFGIQGATRIHLRNPKSKSLRSGVRIQLLSDSGELKLFCISSVLAADKVFLDGVSSREQAGLWVGSTVWVERSAFAPLEDDEIYLSDLIGYRVTDKGEDIGSVVGFSDNGVQILIEIEELTGRRASIPFVRPIVLEIRESEKVIKANLPEGLLEIEESRLK